MKKDRVDTAAAQWRRERPDIDVSAMATVGRLLQAARVIERDYLDPVFGRFGLQRGEFDVLASLRRAGAPYELTPTALYEALMLSSGAMTNRLDRLERAGLVERHPDPADRRGTRVRLSAQGKSMIDTALEAHLANEAGILTGLSDADRVQLDSLLSKLMQGLPKRD